MKRRFMKKKILLLIVLFFGLQILPAQSEYTLELVDRICGRQNLVRFRDLV